MIRAVNSLRQRGRARYRRRVWDFGQSADGTTNRTRLRAERASSFGAHAAAYAEHRPDYPAESIRWALEPVGTNAPVVLDLGAGTGKLTEGLLAIGAEVVAVEPDAAMRAELARRFPEVIASAGAAEAIPLADGSVDAVLAGRLSPPPAPHRRIPHRDNRNAFAHAGHPHTGTQRVARTNLRIPARQTRDSGRRIRPPHPHRCPARRTPPGRYSNTAAELSRAAV
ncbi:class I SAM-dependent methyltransferase [Nocardia vinacea]|uniref:class I SAM-dependent methyltransferase n=1 Tax=Nocardia vinacea TaxID=96468 RepID=UPI00278C0A9E|nr:class I SAM-dependent methyltransferase [Nocardia vinacea]